MSIMGLKEMASKVLDEAILGEAVKFTKAFGQDSDDDGASEKKLVQKIASVLGLGNLTGCNSADDRAPDPRMWNNGPGGKYAVSLGDAKKVPDAIKKLKAAGITSEEWGDRGLIQIKNLR